MVCAFKYSLQNLFDNLKLKSFAKLDDGINASIFMKFYMMRDLVTIEITSLLLYIKEIVLVEFSPLGELSPFGTTRFMMGYFIKNLFWLDRIYGDFNLYCYFNFK